MEAIAVSVLLDGLKSWIMGKVEDNAEKREGRKRILLEFRGLLTEIATDIEMNRVSNGFVTKDLKHQFPGLTSQMARIFGTFETEIPKNVSAELAKIHIQMVNASNTMKFQTFDSDTDEQLEKILLISKQMKEIIDGAVSTI